MIKEYLTKPIAHFLLNSKSLQALSLMSKNEIRIPTSFTMSQHCTRNSDTTIKQEKNKYDI